MIFVAVTLATFWAWEFIFTHADWLPEYISYFLVPLIAVGLFFLPHLYLFALASAALVGLLHRVTHLPVRANTVALPRRRSNIPPPP
jgi:hypothetical protein